MNRERYLEIVRGFQGRGIVVLGDLMMDEYLWGRATRISPESPVMVVEVDNDTRVPGGAANVVNNLVTLGARVAVLGVVGDDEMGRALKSALAETGADVSGVITDPSRPTTRKTRVVAHSQQVMRVDREQTHSISDHVLSQLLECLNESLNKAEALVVSDYNKGILTETLAREAVTAACKANVLMTANPKPPNARSLAGADVITLNQSEAEALSKNGAFSIDDRVDSAGAELVCDLDVSTLVVTRGARGLSLWLRDGSIHHVPAHPVEVYDVAGAGDTVISALTLGAASGATILEAARVANTAAACVVRKLGVATVSPEELITVWEQM